MALAAGGTIITVALLGLTYWWVARAGAAWVWAIPCWIVLPIAYGFLLGRIGAPISILCIAAVLLTAADAILLTRMASTTWGSTWVTLSDLGYVAGGFYAAFYLRSRRRKEATIAAGILMASSLYFVVSLLAVV
jgi:hypothetical protein